MNLTRIENNAGLEFHIDETTQRVYAHTRAIQRMLGLEDDRTLRRRLDSAAKEDVKIAEIHTAPGLRSAALYPSEVVFKLALEFNPSLALAMGSAGANVFMLGLSGYKITAVPQTPTSIAIKPYEENVLIAKSIRTITDTLDDNPRLAQFLIDQTIDQCFSKSLPSEQLPIKGAAEIAESLGLPVTLRNRSALGKFMAKQGHTILREERLCNGQMRAINCYRVTPEVEASIRDFFN